MMDDFVSDEERELYLRAIGQWGIQAQLYMVMEETGELLSVLGKYLRGRAIPSQVCEELVDVQIMIRQLAVILDIELKEGGDTSGLNYPRAPDQGASDDLKRRLRYKLDKLKQRLDEDVEVNDG